MMYNIEVIDEMLKLNNVKFCNIICIYELYGVTLRRKPAVG